MQQPIKIIMLADLHNNRYGENNQTLIQKIEREKPDLIIAAGDIITKHKLCYPSAGFTLLEQLASKYPIYYGYGNHELYFERLMEGIEAEDNEILKSQLIESWIAYRKNLETLGVKFLLNDHDLIQIKGNHIKISGLHLPKEFYPKGKRKAPSLSVDSYLGNSSYGYQILIAHNPMYFKSYSFWGADMILSGHLHGGLARLPYFGGVISPQYNFFPKYDGGIYTRKRSNMLVSKGLGSHSIMLRLFNPADIVCIELDSDKSTKFDKKG